MKLQSSTYQDHDHKSYCSPTLTIARLLHFSKPKGEGLDPFPCTSAGCGHQTIPKPSYPSTNMGKTW